MKCIVNYFEREDGSCKVTIVPQRKQSSLLCTSEFQIGELFKEIQQLNEDKLVSEESTESENDDDNNGQPFNNKLEFFVIAKDVRKDVKTKAYADQKSLREPSVEDIDSVDNMKMDISYQGAYNRVCSKLYKLNCLDDYIGW